LILFGGKVIDRVQ